MTEVHDIETIHQDIPIEVFVSSSLATTENPPMRTRGKPRMESASWRYREDGTYDHRQTTKHVLLNIWLCDENARVGE